MSMLTHDDMGAPRSLFFTTRLSFACGVVDLAFLHHTHR